MKKHRVTRAGLRLAVGTAAVVAAGVAGTAGVARAASCPPPPTPFQPFTQWSDAQSYVLSTGGSFETGTPVWTLSGGAKVVADNAPNRLDPKTDGHALFLPAGSSATSVCVTAPQIVGIVRMFAKSEAASGGQLKVEVLVKGGVYPAGTFTVGTAWTPSPVLVSTAPNYKGAVTYQVRLTAIGTSAVTVDDVYVDPYRVR